MKEDKNLETDLKGDVYDKRLGVKIYSDFETRFYTLVRIAETFSRQIKEGKNTHNNQKLKLMCMCTNAAAHEKVEDSKKLRRLLIWNSVLFASTGLSIGLVF